MSGKNKVLGPQVGYVELLDHYTKKKIEEYSKLPRTTPLRPSAAGKCTRELGYEYDEFKNQTTYEKEPDSPESHRILDFGNSVEYHLIKQFEDAFRQSGSIKIKYKQQKLLFFQLPSGDHIEGSIDSVFVSPKWKALIDYKSKKDKFSSYYANKWIEDEEALKKNPYVQEFGVSSYYIDDLVGFLDNLNDPFWSMNFYQLNLYFFDESKFLRTVGIDHAALIYYNKNDSRMREIRFKPSEEIYNRVKDKFTLVDNTISQGGRPTDLKRDHDLGSSKCAFCKFNKHCWGDDVDPLKSYFKELPRKQWPKDVDRLDNGAELIDLFNKYKSAQQNCEAADLYEKQLVSKLLEKKVFKIRFTDHDIYDVIKRKTGGVKNGPRFVLKKGKA